MSKTLVIAGGSGFLGRVLLRNLPDTFDRVIILTRGPDRDEDRIRYVHWDTSASGSWVKHIDGASAIVNVVGRTVDCVKTDKNKRVIIASRIESVKALQHACAIAQSPPPVWIQAATAHIYGDTGDEILDETSPIGTGFAPEVGLAWEKAFADADLPGTRRVVLRISFVIGKDGGAMAKMVPLTRLFMGGATGSGRQFMSWIHETDFARIVFRAINDPNMQGMYVVTAPQPLQNDAFMHQLRQQLKRPWSPRVPVPMVRIGAMLLRTDPELAIYGRRCIPTRLIAEGFDFRFPDLQSALADLL